VPLGREAVPSRSHPARSRSYSGRAIERTAAMREVPWLVGPFAPMHQQILAFQDQPKTSKGGGLGDRPPPRPQPCSVTRAIRCCHSSPGAPGRPSKTRPHYALSISEAGALSDSLGPIRDGTASAHRQGLTADQAYRTISYDGLATPMQCSYGVGRAGLEPATNGLPTGVTWRRHRIVFVTQNCLPWRFAP
jgi:hypothetical protein